MFVTHVQLAFLLEETARKILPEAVLTCCRFIHESQSYVTTTHINHTIHACTAAASRAAAKAMRDYSLIRATNHGLLLNAAHAPPVVPTPALHAASHQ